MKTLVTLGLDSLQRVGKEAVVSESSPGDTAAGLGGGPFPTFCFCFLCKKLDAFTSVAFCAFRTNLQHSSVWHSVNKKGRM